MELNDFESLLTLQGQLALKRATELAPTEANYLQSLEKLTRTFPRPLAATALQMVLLRIKGRNKFRRADELYFTRIALEQSSSELISNYRAKRFAGFRQIGDFCCGIGADSWSLADRGSVLAIDFDPLKSRMATENARILGQSERIEVRTQDLTVELPEAIDAIFFDPDRRVDQQRHLAIRDYVPPVSSILERLPKSIPMAIKVAPGISWNELDNWEGEKEFISIHGELKECVLWLRGFETAQRRATILPSGESISGNRPEEVQCVEIGSFLYTIDPSLVRAGLEDRLAEQLELHRIEPGLALFTSSSLVQSNFLQPFQVDAVVSASAKKINEYCRTHQIGHLNPIKLGVSIDINALMQQLKRRGDESRSLLLTRYDGKMVAVIAQRLTRPSAP